MINRYFMKMLTRIKNMFSRISQILCANIKNISFFAKTAIAFFLFLIAFFAMTFSGNNSFVFLSSAPIAKHDAISTIENNPYIKSPETDLSSMKQSFSERRDEYNSTKGWLYLPGTDINDPVMQSRDNDFFLRRDSNGKYSYHGCYFADFRVNLNSDKEISQNTVVYGHNIFDDGKTFSQLLQYTNWEHMASYPFIYLVTEQGVFTYQIYAAFYTFTDFYYINPNPNAEEFAYVYNQAIERSLYKTNLQVDQTSKILTLSTCCYKYKTSWGSSRGDQRFVIQAVLIDPSSPPPYTIPENNISPKMPQ